MDLTRGDFASQTAGLMALRNGGIYHADDVLRALRQNPIGEADGGHIRIVQGAYISLTSLLPGAEDNSAAGGGAGTNFRRGEPGRRVTGPSDHRLLPPAVPGMPSGVRSTVVERPNSPGARIYPAVASMAQALVAQRFGNAELSRRELEAVEIAGRGKSPPPPPVGRRKTPRPLRHESQNRFTAHSRWRFYDWKP